MVFFCFFLLKIFFLFFLIIIFYFNNFILFYLTLFYFILFYLSSFFLSSFLFFLPFILSHVDDRLLVLQPGLRAVPLTLESQVQDTGPPETSQLHVISNSKNLPEISISTPRPSSTQRPASQSAGHPMPNNQQDRNTATPISTEAAQNHNKATDTPKHTTRRGPAHQRDKIQPHPPEHRHQSPPPGSLHNPLKQPQLLGTDTKNNGNYELAACEKETPNTIS